MNFHLINRKHIQRNMSGWYKKYKILLIKRLNLIAWPNISTVIIVCDYNKYNFSFILIFIK